MGEKNYYIVKRYLIEEYEIEATSREDAKKQVAIWGDPYGIRILKETVKKQLTKQNESNH